MKYLCTYNVLLHAVTVVNKRKLMPSFMYYFVGLLVTSSYYCLLFSHLITIVQTFCLVDTKLSCIYLVQIWFFDVPHKVILSFFAKKIWFFLHILMVYYIWSSFLLYIYFNCCCCRICLAHAFMQCAVVKTTHIVPAECTLCCCIWLDATGPSLCTEATLHWAAMLADRHVSILPLAPLHTVDEHFIIPASGATMPVSH